MLVLVSQQPLLTDGAELVSIVRAHASHRQRDDRTNQQQRGSECDGEGANHDGDKNTPVEDIAQVRWRYGSESTTVRQFADASPPIIPPQSHVVASRRRLQTTSTGTWSSAGGMTR